jgi:hypothetical protein
MLKSGELAVSAIFYPLVRVISEKALDTVIILSVTRVVYHLISTNPTEYSWCLHE